MELGEAQATAKQNLPPRASEIGQTVREDPRTARHFQQGKQRLED